jgi:hypothetical protein
MKYRSAGRGKASISGRPAPPGVCVGGTVAVGRIGPRGGVAVVAGDVGVAAAAGGVIVAGGVGAGVAQADSMSVVSTSSETRRRIVVMRLILDSEMNGVDYT